MAYDFSQNNDRFNKHSYFTHLSNNESRTADINNLPWMGSTKPTSDFAIKESKQIVQNRETEQNNQLVRYSYAPVLDEQGKPVANFLTPCKDGLQRFTDKLGRMTKVNGSIMGKRTKEEVIKEKYYHSVAQYFNTIDNIADACGMSVEMATTMCGAGGLAKLKLLGSQASQDAFAQIDNVICHPLIVNCYPSGSNAESLARAKLLLIARIFSPYIVHDDNTNVEVETKIDIDENVKSSGALLSK